MANAVKFRLKLLIDEKRNKVVLAEAEQDFVDVLLSLLTLPMGRVAMLLENHQTFSGVLHCYKNLKQSVADMGLDNFETEACKSMLMSLRSTKDIHRKRLKLNMSCTDPTRFFVCRKFCNRAAYSNFNTSRCSCGGLMSSQIIIPEEEQIGGAIGKNEDGVFVNCRSSFIVTDDLKVTSNSIGVLMEVLNDQGYASFSDLREILVDVGFEEVLTLLGCLLTSEAVLTCTSLTKTCMTRKLGMLSPPVPKIGNVNPYSGCFANLCTSPCRGAASRSLDLPKFYICSNNNLLDYTHESTTYECLIPRIYINPHLSCKVARYINRSLFALTKGDKIVTLYPNDPKNKLETSLRCWTGFMKKNTKFIVSNDLTITPMNTSSTIGLLKKTQVDISDIERYRISISKVELINILRASLVSSSALTKGLSNLLVKKPKEEA